MEHGHEEFSQVTRIVMFLLHGDERKNQPREEKAP